MKRIITLILFGTLIAGSLFAGQFYGGKGYLHTNSALVLAPGALDFSWYMRGFAVYDNGLFANGTSALSAAFGFSRHTELGFTQILYQDLNQTSRSAADIRKQALIPGNTYVRIKFGGYPIGGNVVWGVMLALGLLLSGVLAVANKKLYVFEDPRIDEVESQLPSANCGACGFAGCRAFAEAVVSGQASPAQCTASSSEMIDAIAAFLGVDAQRGEKRVARLACAGGDDVAYRFAHYEGRESCRAAALVAGGGKSCTYGCLGYGDCARACPFDALHLNKNNLPVVEESKCTACGNCVTECPKHLFSIHPVSHQLWVACSTHMRGKEAKEACAAACIGCGSCARTLPDVIVMQQNLPVVDYSRNDQASQAAIEKCPTGAIVWLEPGGLAVMGEKARIAREEKTAAAV